MHEYDVNVPTEEQASLPPSSSQQIVLQSYFAKEQPPSEASTATQQLSDFIIVLDSDEEEAEAEAAAQPQRSVIYPAVQQYIDQLPVEPFVPAAPVGEAEAAQKRKRQRRLYVAELACGASLRSRKPTPTPTPTAAASESLEAAQSLQSRSTTPAQASPTPTELEEHRYQKAEFFQAAYWNSIEEASELESKPGKKRRGGVGGRKRRHHRAQIPAIDTNYSPETAAAIAAAQLELNSAAASPTAGRAARKRACTMSLYDRRYQTADERRVGNGVGYSSNAMRTATAGGNEVDAQELPQSHQYYVPNNPASSAIVALGSGLNGGAAVAPSMGTLCNIGNTCYLNSVVYTLRFAPHFLHNLHHLIHDLNVVQQAILRQHSVKSGSLGRGVSGAQQLEQARSWSSKDLATPEQSQQHQSNGSASLSSSSGSGGVASKASHQSVAEKLHDLYHSLHGNEMSDSTEPYHADTLLHAIQDVNSTFEGNQQQDAHEFLMCVLNCIRESNQSLIKSIGECPDVVAQGYIANPDELDGAEAPERVEGGQSALALSQALGGNGALASSQASTTKTSFFSRKSKRKDEVKSSKATRLQSPLKDNAGPLAGSLAATNATFYLNTVDLSGAANQTTTAAAAAATTAKYPSEDELSTANLLKDKMRLEERIRELNLNFFSTDFEGIVVLTTKCLSCETITRQKQGMIDISVPVPISGHDNAELSDKPSAYIQNSCITREYFRGENKYSCNQCTGYTEAIRSISYEVLPRLLVIQLNRFSGGMEKVSTYVPTTFTLQCFCAKCCELSDGNKLHVYKLYSVITHVGATLTVGHYIAYTCFLDLASDYVNCPKDRRSLPASQQQQQPVNENQAPNNGSSSSVASTPVSAAASALASSGTSLMKKMKFGRSKASSSGDMSKNVKQLNGITSKSITNGIGKLSMNTTCHGVNCCAMRLCCGQQPSAAGSSSASSSDFSEESLQNGTNSNLSNNQGYSTGYGSTGRGGVRASYAQPSTEPIWYMCDDDKIKAMSQREFEELLSPSRKITITPYLLFYARFDLQAASAQPTPSKPSTSSTPPPPPPQSSWSNDNLHKM